MRNIAKILLILVTSSCNDGDHDRIRSGVSSEAVKKSPVDWFPKIKDAPAFVPTLPDDFIPGIVTNRYIHGGKPCIAWGRAEDIERLNKGETVTPPIFTVDNAYEDLPDEAIRITPRDREQFISDYTAFGFSDIKCESRKLNGWTFDWFSGVARTGDCYFTAWLSYPDRKGIIEIELVADMTGLPLWEEFVKSIERSEQVCAPNDQ